MKAISKITRKIGAFTKSDQLDPHMNQAIESMARHYEDEGLYTAQAKLLYKDIHKTKELYFWSGVALSVVAGATIGAYAPIPVLAKLALGATAGSAIGVASERLGNEHALRMISKRVSDLDKSTEELEALLSD